MGSFYKLFIEVWLPYFFSNVNNDLLSMLITTVVMLPSPSAFSLLSFIIIQLIIQSRWH